MRNLVGQRELLHTSNVLSFLHRLRAERAQDVLNDAALTVVLLVIVGSTIILLLSDASTVLSRAGSPKRWRNRSGSC